MEARIPPQAIVDEFTRLSDSINIESDPRGGIVVARHALELAQTQEWAWGIASAHAAIAVCCANAGELMDARKHYEIAIPELERLDHRKSLRVKNNYANLLTGDEPELALPIHRSVYQEASADNATAHTAASALLGLGNDYDRLGDTDRFIEFNFQALELAKANHFSEIISVAKVNLAEGFATQGDFESSVQQCLEAIAFESSLGNLRTIAIMKMILGNVYLKMGLLEAAIEAARECLNGTELLGMERPVEALRILGDVAALQGKEEEALGWYEEANKGSSIPANPSKQKTMLSQAKIFLKRDPAKALHILMQLLPLTQSTGDKQNEATTHHALSECFGRMGQTSDALKQFKLYHEVCDRIMSDKTRRQLLVFRVEQEMEKHEAETKELRVRKLHLEKELGNTTLQLLAQTELLSGLRADLLQIARKIPATEPAARELRERVKRLPCESIDWEKFDTQFKAAHPDFVKKLMAAVPDLSPMEIRISTLIRMNLKSEEIARLFCVTERAVEFHRLNIRKKMGLKTKDNLSLALAKM